MPSRAIDFHVHLPTPDWLDGSMAGYVEAAEAYFRSPVSRQSLGELAALYRGLEVTAVLLAWTRRRRRGGRGCRSRPSPLPAATTPTCSPACARSIPTRARRPWPR